MHQYQSGENVFKQLTPSNGVCETGTGCLCPGRGLEIVFKRGTAVSPSVAVPVYTGVVGTCCVFSSTGLAKAAICGMGRQMWGYTARAIGLSCFGTSVMGFARGVSGEWEVIKGNVCSTTEEAGGSRVSLERFLRVLSHCLLNDDSVLFWMSKDLHCIMLGSTSNFSVACSLLILFSVDVRLSLCTLGEPSFKSELSVRSLVVIGYEDWLLFVLW